jgi:hypothetical protein
MTLVLHPGLYQNAVRRDLALLVPAEFWKVDQFGFVELVGGGLASSSHPGLQALQAIIMAPGVIDVSGGEGALPLSVNGVPKRIDDIGGATFCNPASMGPSAYVTIFYDSSWNYGAGYWVRGADGAEMDAPTHIILGHEFGHTLYILNNTSNDQAKNDAAAIAAENVLRAANTPVLPARVNHEGGKKAKPKTQPTSTGGGGGGKGCFVATAAYGSPLHPAVGSLREFRELTLRRTRHGSAFFDHFYQLYDQASAPVVAAINADPELRDVVRDFIVSPIVRYLEMARNFPDLPIEEAGPWAPFLTEVRDGLEAFAAAAPLPTALHDISPADAVDELSVALRFQLRSPERRRAWLHSLVDAGELPLAVSDEGGRRALRDRLEELGVQDQDADVILGPAVPTAAVVMNGAFGSDFGTTAADAVSWRYTVTLRNADPDGAAYLHLRCYYLADPGGPDNMGLVTLSDLQPGEVGVFPLCVCARLLSYYLEADLVLPDGTTGSFVFPDQGSMTAAAAGDPNPCEDSWAF